MGKHQLKFGKEVVSIDIPDSDLLGILKSRDVPCAATEEEAVRNALAAPIGTPCLKDIVKKGEKICIVTCDTTRLWQHPSVYLPILVEELTKSGIPDEDIFFLSGTGTHRAQTPEEHRALIGEDLFNRFKIYDHHSKTDEMTDFGITSRGTPVRFNKRAADSDHVIVTGGVVYHFMAGWGGGKKGILPGIASYETVMANHALTLNPLPAKGRNPVCRSGNVADNLIHLDMVEAVEKLNPSFLLNVVMNASGQIGWAVAGDWKKAYQKGMDIVDTIDSVEIQEKADLVVASACGYPKDINFYQTSKTFFNGREALKVGGALLVLSACSEGYGNEEVQHMLLNFKNNDEREEELRREFTIAKHVGYCTGEVIEQYDFHLVTQMDPSLLEGTGLIASRTVEEAMEKIHKKHGQSLKTWLMPQGATTLPRLVSK